MKTYNRPDYLALSLASLGSSDLTRASGLVICDDHSKDAHVVPLLQAFARRMKFPVRIVVNERNLGTDMNGRKMFREILGNSDRPFMVMLNDDVIYSRDWLNALLQESAPYAESAGLFTVFNTRTHRFTSKVSETVGTKDAVGGLCTMIRREVALFGDLQSSGGLVDWSACLTCKRLGYRIYCTYRSYVNHIGKWGLHHHPDGSIDTATNFTG